MTPQQPEEDSDALRRELAELLGALDESESAAFTDAVAELAMQLPPVAPDPRTKSALLARIDALPQQAPLPQALPQQEALPQQALPQQSVELTSPPSTVQHRAPAEPRGGRAPRAAAPSGPSSGSTRPRSRGQRRRMLRPTLIFGAVVAAAVLFFGGFAAGGLRTGSQPPQQTASSAVSKILAQPDALLSSHAVSGGGTATLVWSDQQGSAAVIMSQTGPAPSGKTYQLWYLRSGAAISAGTFDGSAAAATQELTGHIQSGDQVAITIEPSGGSPQPTTNPIVAIPTSSA